MSSVNLTPSPSPSREGAAPILRQAPSRARILYRVVRMAGRYYVENRFGERIGWVPCEGPFRLLASAWVVYQFKRLFRRHPEAKAGAQDARVSVMWEEVA